MTFRCQHVRWQLMNYGPGAGVPSISEWAPEVIQASAAHMGAIYEELTASGELVGAEGLSGPEAAKIVPYDGVGALVVTDGTLAESKEFLAEVLACRR